MPTQTVRRVALPTAVLITAAGLVGVTTGDLVWPDAEVHRREMTIRASRNATAADFRHVMDAMRTGLVPTDALATHSTDLDHVADDLPRWSHDRTGLIKAIVAIG